MMLDIGNDLSDERIGIVETARGLPLNDAIWRDQDGLRCRVSFQHELVKKFCGSLPACERIT